MLLFFCEKINAALSPPDNLFILRLLNERLLMSINMTNEQFSELITKAKKGKVQELHRYLHQLYQNGRQSLLGLSGSESEAEEYFARAVAKFWEQFVVGDRALPDSNISGYIYTMAKFMCLDHKRKASKIKISSPLEPETVNRKELSESPKLQSEFRAEADAENRQREAMQRAIKLLSENCQNLFQTILSTGLEKPRELFPKLGLKDARAVTVLRYECTKQLKVKAAAELELLVREVQ